MYSVAVEVLGQGDALLKAYHGDHLSRYWVATSVCIGKVPLIALEYYARSKAGVPDASGFLTSTTTRGVSGSISTILVDRVAMSLVGWRR